MQTAFPIRLIGEHDAQMIADAFQAANWPKPLEQYRRYFREQEAGRRVVLLAFRDDTFAGYVTIWWEPAYAPFQAAHIPEIQDFNVLPQHRRRGIGTALMDEAERRVSDRSPVVGIGVGLYADYGAAQRMYVKRGYIPDGRGLIYDGEVVEPMALVRVDDNLQLRLTKQLRT